MRDEQLAGLGRVEISEREPRDALELRQRVALRPARQDDGDRAEPGAAREEADRRERREVEGVRVVHQDELGALPRGVVEQADDGAEDRQRPGLEVALPVEGAVQGGALGLRQRAVGGQERRDDVGEGREGERVLRLDGGGAVDVDEPLGVVPQCVEEAALAGTGRPDDAERPAPAVLEGAEQRREPLPFGPAPDQPRR